MRRLDRVILIDDDEVTNYVHELVIEETHSATDILVAENGQDALHLIQRQLQQDHELPSLIFLDINMPVMNGFEFLEAFRQLEDKLPKPIIVVMLTSSLNPKDIERAKDAGVTDFLDKPLTTTKLEGIVDKYFSQ